MLIMMREQISVNKIESNHCVVEVSKRVIHLCSHCHYKANRIVHFKMPIHRKHAPKRFQCRDCPEENKADSLVRVHVNTVHDDDNDQCKDCHEQHDENALVREHMEDVHED